DNVPVIIKASGFQKLQEGHFNAQPTQERVTKTLKRLEENMQGRVSFLPELLVPLVGTETHAISYAHWGKGVQIRVVLALAHLCSPDDRKTIFIDNNGLELLLELLQSTNQKQKGEASAALHAMAAKGMCASILDPAPTSPTPQVYLGEEYVNNPKLSDVTFIVEVLSVSVNIPFLRTALWKMFR
ncbi:hypothetical protein TSUD_335070, partial [Trifolium subterraneum]